MYNYERKYISEIIQTLSSVKFERSILELIQESTIYNKFLYDIKEKHSKYKEWTDIPASKKLNILTSFKCKENGAKPVAFIGGSIFGSSKSGILFTDCGIYTKGLIGEVDRINLVDFTYSVIRQKKILDVGAIRKKLLPVKMSFLDNAPLCLQRFSINTDENFLRACKVLQKNLCLHTQMNIFYVGNLNNTISLLIDTCREYAESLADATYSIYDFIFDCLTYIYDMTYFLEDERRKEIFKCMYIGKSLTLLSKDILNEKELLQNLSECEKQCAKNIYNIVKEAYVEDHYQENIERAKKNFDKQQYQDSLEYIEKARAYKATNECDILQLQCYVCAANEQNWYNHKEIMNIKSHLSSENIPLKLLQEINMIDCKFKRFIYDLKKSMMNDTMTHSIEKFTLSKDFMILQDFFGMTPGMYLIMYNRDFDITNYDLKYKNSILQCKNVFGHSIIDIAAFISLQKYYDIKLMLDVEFSKSEKEFYKECKLAKLEVKFLKILNCNGDLTKMYYNAIEEGNLDEANYYRHMIPDFSANLPNKDKRMQEDHEREIYGEYIEIIDKALIDLKNFGIQGTEYTDLLNLYKKMIAESSVEEVKRLASSHNFKW